ncbi:YoaK family protein [Streptomyces sp. NPDC056716]|uniref:YoaK family protein n=1 Tax=unclassified Streptomyces TaxID=2593676 RepID=UPI0036A5AAD0
MTSSGPNAVTAARPTSADTAEPSGAVRRDRWVNVQLALLSAAAGATDAVAYLGLGGVFTANMTGNLVLFGIGGAYGADLHLARAVVAVVAYVLGLVVTYSMTPDPGPEASPWPRRVGSALAVSLLTQTALMVVWAACSARPGRGIELVLVGLSAAAMGIQTAVARRLSLAGITTTFITGTLTSMVESLCQGSAKYVLRRGTALLALVLGALIAALLLEAAPVLAAAVAPALVLITLVVAQLRLRRPQC